MLVVDKLSLAFDFFFFFCCFCGTVFVYNSARDTFFTKQVLNKFQNKFYLASKDFKDYNLIF